MSTIILFYPNSGDDSETTHLPCGGDSLRLSQQFRTETLVLQRFFILLAQRLSYAVHLEFPNHGHPSWVLEFGAVTVPNASQSKESGQAVDSFVFEAQEYFQAAPRFIISAH